MPKHRVNLDALIRREDFEIQEPNTSQPARLPSSIKLNDLEGQSVIYQILRKPDFQRETANWEPEKIADLIRSAIDGDLIPSVIMWRSPLTGNVFVIDGGHRLSALIAWVHDDYGDRAISLPFFGHNIQPEQRKAADKTRQLIGDTVGAYEQLKYLVKNPGNASQDQLRRASNVGTFCLDLQWVSGDTNKAEASFFKINQSATLIDPTELRIIKARRLPNALAARALIRSGTGHKYWSGFSDAVQKDVERLAGEIYDILFNPALESPIKTLDLPVAGRGYSAESVKLIFDFVNFVNNVPTPQRSSRKQASADAIAPDADGSVTVEYLKNVRKIASRISGNHPSSLGLHPAVYFYGETGKYQPTAFLATVGLIREFEREDRYAYFTEHRGRFEEFLVRHRYFANQIVNSYGGGSQRMDVFLALYRTILAGVAEGKSDDQIIASFKENQKLRFVRPLKEAEDNDGDWSSSRRNFSGETKSAVFLRQALGNAVRCQICKARIHVKSISFDHVVPKRDGGDGSEDNAQLSHPYCNTGYKESQQAKSAKDAVGA